MPRVLSKAMELVSLGVSTLPDLPGAGEVAIFARTIAGRIFPAFVGPSGLDFPLQPFIGRANATWFKPQSGTATLTANNGQLMTATGTATAKTWAATNMFTSIGGVEFLVTTAATTAVAGFRNTNAQFWRGNAAGLGGFTFVCKWGPATGVVTATSRAFVGLINSTAAPTDVNPSTLTNLFGMGWDDTDTNVQIIYNDNTATATKVDLGASFPVPTVDRTKVYELALFCKPNDTDISYLVTDVTTGATASGTITTTNLPQNGVSLAPKGYMSVGGTSSVIGIALFNLYAETDL